MNAAAFRHLYAYHFAENRKIWELYITQLTSEQFTQDVGYSIGSVRNHIVHLMSVDDGWFSGLRGVELPEWLNPVEFNDMSVIRAYWDGVEARVRGYLDALTDDMLTQKPLSDDPEDKDLLLWQILLHVANHGTDHRAQVLRLLHDLGVKTGPQDYIFYVYDHP
jgi:uncharacterized damage-inducible protein DinB